LGPRFAQSFCGAAKQTDSILSKTVASHGGAKAKLLSSRDARLAGIALKLSAQRRPRQADVPVRSQFADALSLMKG
jgi:hypothetical protein